YSVTDANLKTVANGGHVSNAAGAGTITIDNPGASTATGGGVSSLTIPSFAVGAGANRLLLVGVSVTNNNVNGTRALNSVTFNGVNLLQVTTVASGDDRVWIYRMVNPPNVTADIVATFAGTTGGVLGPCRLRVSIRPRHWGRRSPRAKAMAVSRCRRRRMSGFS